MSGPELQQRCIHLALLDDIDKIADKSAQIEKYKMENIYLKCRVEWLAGRYNSLEEKLEDVKAKLYEGQQ